LQSRPCIRCERHGSIERTDGRFPARQRAAFVPIERRSPRNRHFIQRNGREKLAARAPHAYDIDRRRGNATGEREAHSRFGNRW
jgi:hypothetical protein